MRTLLVLALCAVALPAAAQEVVSVGDLLLEPAVYNETEVAVVGELVGDYSKRDQEVWVQLNDDDYVDAPLGEPGSEGNSTNTGIGIRIPLGLFDEVVTDPPGRYGWRGPKITVTGVFLHFDPELGGETYIDATDLGLVEPGRPIATPGPGVALIVGPLLALVGVGIFLTARRRNQ